MVVESMVVVTIEHYCFLWNLDMEWHSPRLSHLMFVCHTSYLLPLTPYPLSLTPYPLPLTPYLLPLTSYLLPRTSYLLLYFYLLCRLAWTSTAHD